MARAFDDCPRNRLSFSVRIGQVPLVSGEIAEDITNYFAISEQTPTVCALGVLVNPDLTVQCAGGFIVQLMPGATEDEITRLEKNIGAMPGITTLLQQIFPSSLPGQFRSKLKPLYRTITHRQAFAGFRFP